MRWPTIEDLRRLVPLPAGYDYEQLKRADVPELIASIERWHPDVKVGVGSAYLRKAFYDEKVPLAGEAERDTFAVLFRHGGRIATRCSRPGASPADRPVRRSPPRRAAACRRASP
jgi:hypothetical protein